MSTSSKTQRTRVASPSFSPNSVKSSPSNVFLSFGCIIIIAMLMLTVSLGPFLWFHPKEFEVLKSSSIKTIMKLCHFGNLGTRDHDFKTDGQHLNSRRRRRSNGEVIAPLTQRMINQRKRLLQNATTSTDDSKNSDDRNFSSSSYQHQRISIVIPVRGRYSFPSDDFLSGLRKSINDESSSKIFFDVVFVITANTDHTASEMKQKLLEYAMSQRLLFSSKLNKTNNKITIINAKEHSSLKIIPLGQLLTLGIEHSSPQSDFLLFLSTFTRILEPSFFFAGLLKDFDAMTTISSNAVDVRDSSCDEKENDQRPHYSRNSERLLRKAEHQHRIFATNNNNRKRSDAPWKALVQNDVIYQSSPTTKVIKSPITTPINKNQTRDDDNDDERLFRKIKALQRTFDEELAGEVIFEKNEEKRRRAELLKKKQTKKKKECHSNKKKHQLNIMIQCMMLQSTEPTSTGDSNDEDEVPYRDSFRSTPFLIADGGWSVDLSSNNPNANYNRVEEVNHYEKERMKKVKRKSSSPNRYSSTSSASSSSTIQFFDESLYFANREAGNIFVPSSSSASSSKPTFIDAASAPSCFFVHKKSFIESGAFIFSDIESNADASDRHPFSAVNIVEGSPSNDEHGDDPLLTSIPTTIDLILSAADDDFEHNSHDRDDAAATDSSHQHDKSKQENTQQQQHHSSSSSPSSSVLDMTAGVHYQQASVDALFECIVAVEDIMDEMQVNEVRRASQSLRRQVRTSYAAVMAEIQTFTDLSGESISWARARKQLAMMQNNNNNNQEGANTNLMLTKQSFPKITFGKIHQKLLLESKKQFARGVTMNYNNNNAASSSIDPEEILSEVVIDTSLRNREKEDPCLVSPSSSLQKVSTEAKLKCMTERLSMMGVVARAIAHFKRTSISEFLLGWLPSIRMRKLSSNNKKGLLENNKNTVLLSSSSSAVVYDFSVDHQHQQFHDHHHHHHHQTENALRDFFSTTSVMIARDDFLQPWLPYIRSFYKAYQPFVKVAIPDDENNDNDDVEVDLFYPPRTSLHHNRDENTDDENFIRVVWFQICCGCCGFSAEVAHFVRPLSRLMPVSVTMGLQCFCPGLPSGFTDVLSRLHIAPQQYSDNEFLPSSLFADNNINNENYDHHQRRHRHDDEKLIWISHTDPLSWVQQGFFLRRQPAYLIARTMYEFSRIPTKWDPYLGVADEYWVPSEFCRKILLDASYYINNKLLLLANFSSSPSIMKTILPHQVFIIPEGIDTNFYSPLAHRNSLRFVSNEQEDLKTAPASWRNHMYCNRDSFWSSSANNDDDNNNKKKKNSFFPPEHHRNKKWSRPESDEELSNLNPFFQNRSQHFTPGAFEFFSNFKWETRKGWDILFKAYWDAFYNVQDTEDTTLFVLSYIFYKDGTPDHWSVFNESYILEDLQKLMENYYHSSQEEAAAETGDDHHYSSNQQHSRRRYKHLAELPRFCILSESVSEFELAQLFRGADAFVLPTRGEGWGLPTMQAMSMGLPVISTNWGGSIDFTTKETSYLIELDGVEEVPKDSPYGWREGKKWAIPSQSHLEELMMTVYQVRDFATNVVGDRARKHIAENFDDEEVVKVVEKRLKEIGREL